MLERVPPLVGFEEFLSTNGNREVLWNLINEDWEESKKNRGHVSSLMSVFNYIITVFNLGAPLQAVNPATNLGETNNEYHVPPEIEAIMQAELSESDLYNARCAYLMLYQQNILRDQMTKDEIVDYLRSNAIQ